MYEYMNLIPGTAPTWYLVNVLCANHGDAAEPSPAPIFRGLQYGHQDLETNSKI